MSDGTPTLPPIWPNGLQIPVIGAAGEYQSGKTLFGLTIDPTNTLMFDFEKSASIYEGLEMKRVDVPDHMLREKPEGYQPIDVFEWWYAAVKSIPPGRFSVIMADPISDIEQGVVDWVKAHPEHFGSTATQYERMSGLLWGDVKSYWKTILVDIAARCQTFFFTAHMRQVWSGNTPTSRREPKGKDTLMELASLYFLLERKPDKQGKVPASPSGIVIKSRLAHTKLVDGIPVVQPMLPPRLPTCTPLEVRNYIENPPDYNKLKKDEKIPEVVLTDDQKLEMKMQIAADEREAAELNASRFQKMQKAAQAQKQQMATRTRTVEQQSAAKQAETVADAARAQDGPAEPQRPADLPGQSKMFEDVKKEPDEDVELPFDIPFEDPDNPGQLNPKIIDIIKQQMTDLGMNKEQAIAACRKRGAEKLSELTVEAGKDLHSKLWNMLTARDTEKELAKKK